MARMTPLDAEHAESFKQRLRALTPETPRRFGTLDATALLAHLRRTFEITFEEHPMPDQSNWFTRGPMAWLVIDVLPWPKGKVKAPADFTPETAGDFEAEREALMGWIDRFTQAAQTPGATVYSPVWGRMPMRKAARLHGKHLEHHLQQFGV